MNREFIDKLTKHVADGYVAQQDHPTEPLSIFSYTNKCQFERKWDEVTLQCRGLILGEDYELVSRPFKKFFNLSEHGPEFHMPGPYKVYVKYDGSCLISYWRAGKMYWASRGSFTSDQANWANELWQELYPNGELWLNPRHTYVAELIHPDNRIVVDYGQKKKIIFTAAIHTETGKELDLEMLPGRFFIAEQRRIRKSLRDLAALNPPNEEGYVLKSKDGFRVKIKFDEYVRLHKIVTNISSYDIWEALKLGKPLDEILDRVPDEFYDWVRKTESDLNCHKSMMWTYARIKLDEVKCKLGDAPRKEYAAEFLKTKHPDILFKMLDGADVDQIIWDKIKPEYQKPFSNEHKDKPRTGELVV